MEFDACETLGELCWLLIAFGGFAFTAFAVRCILCR